MNITEAEFDALEYVAVEGRIAAYDKPHISSLLERLRPFSKRETDSPQAHATLGEGSVQGKDTVGPAPVECSRSVRGSARPSADSVGGAGPIFSRPVASAGSHDNAMATARQWYRSVEAWGMKGSILTDEERLAVAYFSTFRGSPREADAKHGKTLRSLLARLSSCHICHGTGRVAVRMGIEPCSRCGGA